MPVRQQSGLHHPVSVYAKQVVRGKFNTQCCKAEIAACQRHLDDLGRQGKKDFPYVFDATRADRILQFFALCHHVRGVFSGQPIELLPFQVFDLGCLYGWVHKDTGARRFTRSYNKRGRGNVKSTEASGMALYHMTADCIYPPYQPELAVFEASPEVECAAVDRGQADRVYSDAKAIAKASNAIAAHLIIKQTKCYHKTRGGFMRALSKDTDNKDSGAPSFFLCDEYHAHKKSDIYDIGLNSLGKRPQALLSVITTAGDDADHKPCKVEEDYCKRILFEPEVQTAEPNYFVMIRELDTDDNPHELSKLVKANPVLRTDNAYSRTLREQIGNEYTTAYQSGDADKIRKFLTRRCCLWQAASVNHYASEQVMAAFDAACLPVSDFNTLTSGLACHIGFDLGKRIDLSGVAAVFPLQDGRIAISAHGFMPENSAERHEKSDRVPYKIWARDGYCTLTPGDVTDNSYVDNWICAGERDYAWQVDEVDYDGHNATDLAIKMAAQRGEDCIVSIPQTCAGQNLACKRFREMLLQGQLVICHSPLLRWCLSNAIEVVNNYGDIKLSKRHKDDSQRIDPLAAVMNALGRVLVRQDAEQNGLAEAVASPDFSL